MAAQRMTEDELNVLARRAAIGEVFVGNSDEALRCTWGAVIALVPRDDHEELFRDVGALWEEMSKAGPRSINGFPFFTSFHTIHVDDVETLSRLIDEKRRALETL